MTPGHDYDRRIAEPHPPLDIGDHRGGHTLAVKEVEGRTGNVQGGEDIVHGGLVAVEEQVEEQADGGRRHEVRQVICRAEELHAPDPVEGEDEGQQQRRSHLRDEVAQPDAEGVPDREIEYLIAQKPREILETKVADGTEPVPLLKAEVDGVYDGYRPNTRKTRKKGATKR